MLKLNLFKAGANFYLFLLVLFSPLMGKAEGLWIDFKLKSGSHLSIPFDENTSLKFNDGKINIGNEWYAVTEVQSYTFSSEESRIEIIEGETALNLRIENGIIYLKNIDRNLDISLHDISGITYPLTIQNLDANTKVVDINGLSPNIYLLNVNGETLKLMKR